MNDLIGVLRTAMEEHTADVSVPATLVGDVRRRNRRHRARVTTATAAGAFLVVAVAAGAVPAYRAGPADGPQPASVATRTVPAPRGGVLAGVTVGYLPAGLTRDGRDTHYGEGPYRTTSRAWKDAAHHGTRGTVKVTVYHGPATRTWSSLRRSHDYLRGTPARVHGRPALLGGGDTERFLFWQERPGLGLYVSVSATPHDLAGRLPRIADGLRPAR